MLNDLFLFSLAGQQKDDLALIAAKFDGDIVMGSSTPIDMSNKTPFDFSLSGDELADHTVVAGCDANEDGELQDDEVTATASDNARIATTAAHAWPTGWCWTPVSGSRGWPCSISCRPTLCGSR